MKPRHNIVLKRPEHCLACGATHWFIPLDEHVVVDRMTAIVYYWHCPCGGNLVHAIDRILKRDNRQSTKYIYAARS